MKFIRKALWPTAIVAAALMLFGALGSAINADTLGDVQSSDRCDNVVEAGEEVAIYVVVSADTDDRAAPKKAAVRDAVDDRRRCRLSSGRRPRRSCSHKGARSHLR